jgi:hypothetical protein
VVSSRGGKHGYVARSRHDAYRSLRKKRGLSKSVAAAIANKGRTKGGRVVMARKAAATRRRKKG